MKEEYKNVALCSSNGCKVADLCRRAMGYKTITTEDKTLKMVNPMLTTNDENCPMYSHLETVRFAKGFMKLQDEMSRTKFDALKQQLLAYYGKNPYYEMRKGTRLISPEDQRFIAQAVSKTGATISDPFDEYVEQEVWK